MKKALPLVIASLMLGACSSGGGTGASHTPTTTVVTPSATTTPSNTTTNPTTPTPATSTPSTPANTYTAPNSAPTSPFSVKITDILQPETGVTYVDTYIRIGGTKYDLTDTLTLNLSTGTHVLPLEGNMQSDNERVTATGKAYIIRQANSVMAVQEGNISAYEEGATLSANKAVNDLFVTGETPSLLTLQRKNGVARYEGVALLGKNTMTQLPPTAKVIGTGVVDHKFNYTVDFDAKQGSGTITGQFGTFNLGEAKFLTNHHSRADGKVTRVDNPSVSGDYHVHLFGDQAQEIAGNIDVGVDERTAISGGFIGTQKP